MSITSKNITESFDDRDINKALDDLPNNELIDTVHELQADAKRVELENQIFENFLMANEPSLISSMAQTLEAVKRLGIPTQVPVAVGALVAPVSSGVISAASPHTSTDVSATTQSNLYRGPRINLSQKTDLVMREIEAMQNSLEKFVAISHKKESCLKAEIEESHIRAQEVKESRDDFEQAIVIEAVEKLTQKIPAEKFVRYMQEWLKSAQFMLEKLRLRTSSLRIQQNKLRNVLTQKEELGECVHEVDFEKLKIENKNFQIKIEQKNSHLLELKQINGKASLMLTNHKNILQKQDESIKNLKKSIKNSQRRIIELTEERSFTKEEVEAEKQRYQRLKKFVDLYQVPDVIEYIKRKAELSDLHRGLKTWRRKRNIQKIAMSTYTKMMMHMTGQMKPRPSWYDADTSMFERKKMGSNYSSPNNNISEDSNTTF